MSFTAIVLTGCFLSLVLGVAMLLFERGYNFDLRRRRSQRVIAGGRRMSDRLAA